MDPQQELFTALLLQLKEAFPGKVYDGFLPPEDTPYPFVYLADSQLIDTEMKNAVTGTVYQTIDVWHSTPEKRGTVSAMLLQIKGICRKLEHTDNFAWLIHNIDPVSYTHLDVYKRQERRSLITICSWQSFGRFARWQISWGSIRRSISLQGIRWEIFRIIS